MGHAGRLHHARGDGSGSGGLVLLVAPPRVGVVVYPRMAGELVGAAEAFRASGEGTGMGLLSSVGPDVAGLVLKTMEGLLAEGTLVGARELVLAGGIVLGVLEERSHEAHGGSGHGRVGRGRGLLGSVSGGAVVVEEVSKTLRC